VDAGLSPYEALQSATYVAARSMGLDQDLGSIAAGKLADMVIVSGDPLADISDARSVLHTVKNGLMYHVEELKAVYGK